MYILIDIHVYKFDLKGAFVSNDEKFLKKKSEESAKNENKFYEKQKKIHPQTFFPL